MKIRNRGYFDQNEIENSCFVEILLEEVLRRFLRSFKTSSIGMLTNQDTYSLVRLLPLDEKAMRNKPLWLIIMITFEILLTRASTKPLAQCISNCVPVREPVYRLQLFFRFGILYDTT